MPKARQLLREVLEAPLRFEPDGPVYKFSGVVATGTLVSGAVLSECVASPMPGSWNHIVAWLKQIDAVRQAA